jgi:hypothetical protein
MVGVNAHGDGAEVGGIRGPDYFGGLSSGFSWSYMIFTQDFKNFF